MSNSFKPLYPQNTSSTAQTHFRATQSSPAQPKTGFVPLTTQSAKAQAASNTGAAAPVHSPTITLEREGEVVKRIRIQCVCGQTIELECC